MGRLNYGALKWANHGQRDQRYADGYRPGTVYALDRLGPVAGSGIRWRARFYEADNTVQTLGEGNFIQARAYAIVHHHQQKSIPF